MRDILPIWKGIIMDCYFAPMEGVTGYVFRNAHRRFYGNITKYFSPFLAPNCSRKLSSRERNDILPEHNKGIMLVPQVLTNRAEDFIWAAQAIQEFGYGEVNLNLGCPSGTVVTKYRGAGFLALPQELDRFLEKAARGMEQMGMKFSIKTRIGKSDPDEFRQLLLIFNRYPLEKLIIHPRLQTDFYQNRPNFPVFQYAVEHSSNPLCYNGDIFSEEDFICFQNQFPTVPSIMLGRGLLQNPALAETIADRGKDPTGKNPPQQRLLRLRAFHDAVLEGYQNTIPGDRNVLFKMKELWSYWGKNFPGEGHLLKKLKKSRWIPEYTEAVDGILPRPPVS